MDRQGVSRLQIDEGLSYWFGAAAAICVLVNCFVLVSGHVAAVDVTRAGAGRGLSAGPVTDALWLPLAIIPLQSGGSPVVVQDCSAGIHPEANRGGTRPLPPGAVAPAPTRGCQRGRTLPSVRWLSDLYCACVLREQGGPGNQPNRTSHPRAMLTQPKHVRAHRGSE